MTSTLPAPPERAKSQPQRVFDSVAARIRGGLLKPGERVPSEPELMRELGVSRTVVREAMSRLLCRLNVCATKVGSHVRWNF